jgi:hypothetical protein
MNIISPEKTGISLRSALWLWPSTYPYPSQD